MAKSPKKFCFIPSTHHAMWVIIISAIFVFLIFQMVAIPSQVERLDALPLRGDDYSGETIRFSSDELRVLDGADAIKRLYTIDHNPFLVYVIDGTHNEHASHEPNKFFLENGWQIVNERLIPLALGEGTLLTLQRDSNRRELVYWYTTGEMQHVSSWKLRLQSWMRRLTFGSSNDEPLLVIVESETPGTVNWEKTLNDFPELLNF